MSVTITASDVNKLRHCLRGEAEIYLITANLTSNQFEDKKALISDLLDVINRNYYADDLSLVDENIKINFSK